MAGQLDPEQHESVSAGGCPAVLLTSRNRPPGPSCQRSLSENQIERLAKECPAEFCELLGDALGMDNLEEEQ